MLPDLAKKLLYGSGALGLYHRIRNSRSLTVVMFHRVLSPDDPRWQSCDPDYTLSTDLLKRSLDFFKRHYNVVSLAQLLESRSIGTRLPPRPLLITFDDGWADNADFALPELQRAGLPALMFVVADAVGTRQPFYQECLVAAWRRGALSVADLVASLRHQVPAADISPAETIESLRRVIAHVESLEPAQRKRVLAPFAAALDDGLRHMVSVEDLQRLRQGGVTLGLHGKTHAPMTSVADLDVELGGARAALADHLGEAGPTAESMSFPHGAHDREIARRANDAGYRLVFTSVPVLNPVRPQPGWLLGRTGFDAAVVVDTRGRFRPDRLALYLFRRERRRLA